MATVSWLRNSILTHFSQIYSAFLYADSICLPQHLLWSRFNRVDLFTLYDGGLTRVTLLENTTMKLFRGESFIAREKVSS